MPNIVKYIYRFLPQNNLSNMLELIFALGANAYVSSFDIIIISEFRYMVLLIAGSCPPPEIGAVNNAPIEYYG